MTREQRYKYEMFVRVRDYGTAHRDLFPESSTGGRTFAMVAAALARIDEYLKNHILARAEARRVKVATRAAVFNYMKTITLVARRATRHEPSASPFRMPQRRSLKVDVSTARGFIDAAAPRQAEFIRLGLPATFISDFRALVDTLQEAADTRLSSKTVRRHALAGLATALADAFDAVHELDVVVALATRNDPTRFAAWQSARRIEGQGAKRARTTKAVKNAASSVAAPAGVVDDATATEVAAPVAETPGAEAAAVPPLQQVFGRAS